MLNKIRPFVLFAIIVTALVGCFVMNDAKSKDASDKRFDIAMQTVLRHEGGLSHDKNDPGGYTKYGISLRFLKDSKIDPNGDGVEDKEDIIHLTQTEADKIYYVEWYKKYNYGKINDVRIMTKIMDFSINAGASECHKLVKRAVNAIVTPEIKVNGKLDDKTIEIINLIEPAVFHDAFRNEQEEFYEELVKRNPHLRIFLAGWLARARD